MKYDKNSFLAGISVGMTLKGWACAGDSGVGGKLSEIIVRSGTNDFIEVPAEGFYGIGKVTVLGDAKLTPENIKLGVSILGVTGTYAPSFTLQSRSLLAKTNGVWTVSPQIGYDGLSHVKVTVDVPSEVISQVKSVTPGRGQITVTPDAGYNSLSEVYVYGDDDLIANNIRAGITIFGVTGTYNDFKTQSKSVVPASYSQRIYPDSNFDALSSVYVSGDGDLVPSNIREGVEIFGVKGAYSTGLNFQTKTVTPNRYGFSVIADDGFNALARVVVNGDSNLIPENIARGVTIFGVSGTHISAMKPITVIPSRDEQYILPTDGFTGFSSVTVAPAEVSGDYSEGYADGVASRDNEVAQLQEQIRTLTQERDEAYKNGYDAGYDAGTNDVVASFKNLDEEAF